MIKANAKKICIVVSSLAQGGAERSSAILSEILFGLGYEVHVVTVLDMVHYPYKGHLLNLGKFKAKDDTPLGRLKRLKVFKNYLKTHNFDYVIDNRTRIGLKELIISKWLYNSKNTIYCVRSYNTDMYINSSRFLGKILYKSAYKIVPVSNAIAEKLNYDFGFENLEVIHNPVAIDIEDNHTENTTKGTYILFFGRLDDDVKNISLLFEAYSKSQLPQNSVNLKILGNGKDEQFLKDKSNALGLNKTVEFLEFQSNPYSYVEAAFFTILTSRYEGFPRVLVESLALGTPVISVDCKSGPSEIIVNEYNGLLVENYNVNALTKAMNRILEDKDLYLHCKSNAKKSVEKFSQEVIGQQWEALLK